MVADAVAANWATNGPHACRQRLLRAVELAALALLRDFAAASRAGGLEVGRASTGRGASTEPEERLAAFLASSLRGSKVGGLVRAVALLDSIHGLLTSGRHATPRELFYTHAGLFQRQEQSNQVIKRLCQVLQVPRHSLNLMGTAKGLIRGHARLLEPRPDGSVARIDCLDPLEPRGHSISPLCAHSLRVESAARCVLVVEKETVFHRLLDDGLLERHGHCIFVTARGFPDVPTRYLLRRLQKDCGAPRVLLLVDADAFGLSIAATYAFGPEDASWLQDDLALPDAELLACVGGLAEAQSSFGLPPHCTAPLTPRDVATAGGLARRFAALRLHLGAAGAARMAPWERAASRILETGVKYELDAMDGLARLVEGALVA